MGKSRINILKAEIEILGELNALTGLIAHTPDLGDEKLLEIIEKRGDLLGRLTGLENKAQNLSQPEPGDEEEQTLIKKLKEETAALQTLEKEAGENLDRILLALKNMTSNLDRTRQGLLSYFGPQNRLSRYTDRKG